MSKSITDLIGGNDRVKQFKKLSAGKTKEELRKLEVNLLTPEKIPAYTGRQAKQSVIEQCTLKIIFPTTECLELLGKHIRISSYKEKNTTDIGLIMALLDRLEDGSLSWGAKNKILSIPTKEV